jgi:hypothetical protein
MSKHQMIDEIRQLNRSASPDFLQRFDDETLGDYLRRLTRLHGHRGRETSWVRETPHPAVTMRMCA